MNTIGFDAQCLILRFVGRNDVLEQVPQYINNTTVPQSHKTFYSAVLFSRENIVRHLLSKPALVRDLDPDRVLKKLLANSTIWREDVDLRICIAISLRNVLDFPDSSLMLARDKAFFDFSLPTVRVLDALSPPKGPPPESMLESAGRHYDLARHVLENYALDRKRIAQLFEFACLHGDTDIMRLVRGFDPAAHTTNLFERMCENGSLQTVVFLHREGVKFNTGLAVLNACAADNLPVVTYLCEMVSMEGVDVEEMVSVACREGAFGSVQFLLDKYYQTEERWEVHEAVETWICAAAVFEHVELVEFLARRFCYSRADLEELSYLRGAFAPGLLESVGVL